MFRVGKPCFLLVTTASNQKILKVGKVLEADDQNVTVEFEEQVAPAVGEPATLYAEKSTKFFQQPVTTIMDCGGVGKPTYSFMKVGQPVSAEQRGTYRVSVVSANLPARVGKMRHCQLADVSPEGVAVICQNGLAIGQSVEVEFVVEGITLYGALRVQTAKTLTPTKTRYGFLAPEPKSVMRRSLERVASTMQRYQLKRMSGAA